MVGLQKVVAAAGIKALGGAPPALGQGVLAMAGGAWEGNCLQAHGPHGGLEKEYSGVGGKGSQ